MAQFDSMDEVILFARDLVDIDAPVEALAEFVSDLARMELIETPDGEEASEVCTCEQSFGPCFGCQVAFVRDTQGSDRGPVPMYYIGSVPVDPGQQDRDEMGRNG